MGFICTIAEGDFSGSVFKKGNSYAAMYPIGFDDTGDKSYVLFVSLDPVVGDPDSLELSFRVIEYDGETDSEHVFWSGKDVATFIQKDDRLLILRLLAAAVSHLLKSANPARVCVCSRDAYAPDKANVKFIKLAHVFKLCGYSVKTADTYYGLRCWWMERSAGVTI